MSQKFLVQIAFDKALGIWYTEQTNIPGLTAEAETCEALIEKVRRYAVVLLSARADDADIDDLHEVPIHIAHIEKIRIPANLMAPL